MPPQKIEIWGGNNPKQLKLLNKLTPQQPTMLIPAYLRGFEYKFTPKTVKYIKIVGTPVGKLIHQIVRLLIFNNINNLR